jgi:prepilin-type N-terminal cleavage/methylation domain-containing protein
MTTRRKEQSGFTLLEMSLVLLVMAAIAIPATEGIKQQARKLKLERGAREVVAIQEAGLRYYQDNGAWPGNLNTLVTTNYLPAGATISPWGTTYDLTPLGNNLTISVTTSAPSHATQLQSRLPFTTVTNNTVASTIGIPGTETAHLALTPRDGSRAWTGSHNAGGNSLSNVNTANAIRVNASNEVTASTRITSPRFEDSNNPAFAIDPNSTSIVNRIDATSQMRAPILYDSNNTAYYVDPSSVSVMNDVRASIFYDQNNTGYYVNPASTSIMNDVRASIFYDRNNTGYYVDPASTTNLNVAYAQSQIRAPRYYDLNNTAYYVDPASTSIMNDVRASIFYDRNNTAYYVNPASITNLNRLFVGGKEVKAPHKATFSRWTNYGTYGNLNFTLSANEYICGQQTHSIACGLANSCARYRICLD